MQELYARTIASADACARSFHAKKSCKGEAKARPFPLQMNIERFLKTIDGYMRLAVYIERTSFPISKPLD